MSIVGKLLGSLVCAILFGAIGFFAGLFFPWHSNRHDGYGSTPKE